MMRSSLVLIIGLVLGAAAMAFAQESASPAKAVDPTVSDGDKYKVILENERVRVLDYQDKPGAKTKLHHHDAFVLYALSPFKRQLTYADGKVAARDFKPGDVIFMKAQEHVGENIGTTDTHVLIVELKEPPPAAPSVTK